MEGFIRAPSLYFHVIDCRVDLWNYLMNPSNKQEIMKNFGQVIIYNKHLSVTRIEEVPAYTLDQLFSDMGE